MENYKIVTDETILKDFIKFLPELKESETYYLSLFARSKYCKDVSHISSDKAQLKRFTTTKERMFEKIKQLEIQLGNYTQKGLCIPQEAIAIYITPNPRCFLKATRQSLKKFADLLAGEYTGYNPHQQVMSEIQKAKSRTCFVDFDFDILSKEDYINCIQNVKNILNKESYIILRTHGGFHLLVMPKFVNQNEKRWYQMISNISEVDIKGDNMIPIPGTYQGGFTPKIEYSL